MQHRGYVIENDGTYNLKWIRYDGKGSLPNELRGGYMDFNSAKKAIDIYLVKKENKNGETNLRS